MGKTRGSSSKRPSMEEEHEEEDLSQTYKAKFPLFTHEEGSKFASIKFREIVGCKYIPTSLLNNVGMLEVFDQMLIQCGLKKFVSMHEDTYVELITEFYTTLDVNENNSQILEFRMQGKQHKLTYSIMQRIFGFKKDGLCDPPSSFKLNEFWTFLTDLQEPFNPKKGKAMFIKDVKYWLLHKVLACVIFHKTEFNRVSAQELFLIWCIHHKKQVSWTYWIFNQLLTCAPHKGAPLTHGHVITIIAKGLNVPLDDSTRIVRHSYFTKQAFVRGEIVDAAFRLIPPHSRSCWHGIAGSSRVEEPPMENPTESPPPPYQSPDDVPVLPYPMQDAPGSSTDHSPIWSQILNNQLAMQRQLNDMQFHQQQLARRQRKMEYKLNQYFIQSGHSIESPPTTPTDD